MPASGFDRFLRYAGWFLFAAATLLLLVSGAIYFDWSRDNAIMRRQAVEVTKDAGSTAAAIIALNHWVYSDGGFAKNHRYYWWQKLGPTPLQILRSGGDCADKSRLLSAMLRQIGISSGLVMVYPCQSCQPIHTVVEATYGKGRMVVDPIWDIEYPAGGGRYYGVRELAGTALGRTWLTQVQAQSSPVAKIAAMRPEEATFDYARGLNWDRNPAMKLAAAMLERMHVQPALLPRPRILEDPQLALWASLLLTSAVLFAAGLAVRARHRRG